MSRNKKNMLTVLFLLAALVIVCVLYVVVPKGESGDEQSDAEEESGITVDTIDTEQVVEIAVSKSGKEVYHLKKEKNIWEFADDKSLPVDEDSVNSLLESAASVTATKELAFDEAEKSNYGVEEPALTIKIVTSDKTYQYDLGDEVPIEGGFYGLASGKDKIYCLSDSLMSAFDVKAKALIQKDEIPEITESEMTAVEVDNKKGDDFKAEVVKKSERVESDISWNITKPYAKPLAASDEDWSTTLGYFNTLEFGDLVEYGAKNLSKYGLAHPSSVITVRYKKNKKEKNYVLLVGEQKDDVYYVCLKNSSNVYEMTSGEVEQMTKLDAYSCMNQKVYNQTVTEVKGYDVTFGNTTIRVTGSLKKEKTSEEEESEDTVTASDYIWSLNGKTIDDEDVTSFVAPYSDAGQITYSGKADKSVKPKDKKAVLKMVYHEEGRDVTITYYPYDGTNFYRVDRDGMDYFLVDKKAVDEVIGQFKSIKNMGK